MLQDISNTFVVVLGVSVVFIGLICIVLLCKIVSAVCRLSERLLLQIQHRLPPVCNQLKTVRRLSPLFLLSLQRSLELTFQLSEFYLSKKSNLKKKVF